MARIREQHQDESGRTSRSWRNDDVRRAHLFPRRFERAGNNRCWILAAVAKRLNDGNARTRQRVDKRLPRPERLSR